MSKYHVPFSENLFILYCTLKIKFTCCCKVVLHFESADEILKCDHSTESY